MIHGKILNAEEHAGADVSRRVVWGGVRGRTEEEEEDLTTYHRAWAPVHWGMPDPLGIPSGLDSGNGARYWALGRP